MRVLAHPDLRDKLIELGFIVVGSVPEALGAQIKAEIPKKGKLVRDAAATVN